MTTLAFGFGVLRFIIPSPLDLLEGQFQISPVLCFAKWIGVLPVQRGNQILFCESERDRGERCAASRAFNGSSPTANLVSNIKGQRKSWNRLLAE
jgi:hypothetical protein